MAEERENILRVDVDIETAGKELTDLVKELKAVQKQQAEFNKQLKEGNELSEEQQKQYGENVKRLDQLKKSQKQATNEIVTGIKSQRGSLNDLRKDLKRLVDQRNKISLDTKEGQQAVKELNEEIESLNDEIKDIEEGGGDFRRSVGNYARAFEGVNPLIGQATLLLDGFKLSAFATRAALLAIPFVAIVAILAVFITKLSESEKFTRLLSRAFALLKDIAQPALDALNVALNATIGFLDSAISLAEDFFSSTKDGAEAAEDSFVSLEKRRQALVDQTREFQVLNRSLIKQEEALKNIRDDDRRSIDERIKANQQLRAIEEERLNRAIELQEERIKLIEDEIAKNGGEATTNSETLNKLTEERVALEELIEESIGRQNEQITNQVALEQELFDITQEIAAKRAEVAELEAETEKERFEAKQAQLETELRSEEEAVRRRGLNKKQENELLLLLEREFLEKQEELRAEFQLAEIERNVENKEDESESLLDIAKNETDKNIANSQTRISQQKQETDNFKGEKDKEEKINAAAELAKLQATFNQLSQGAALLGESTALYKGVKITETFISTIAGVQKALAEPTLPYPANAIQAGIISATGAANIAQIAAAAGGGDFITKGPQLLLVGDNPGGQERVTINPIGARGTTTPGSNLTSVNQNRAADSAFDQSQSIANAIAQTPPPVLVVKDYQKAERRVSVKQSASSL